MPENGVRNDNSQYVGDDLCPDKTVHAQNVIEQKQHRDIEPCPAQHGQEQRALPIAEPLIEKNHEEAERRMLEAYQEYQDGGTAALLAELYTFSEEKCDYKKSD